MLLLLLIGIGYMEYMLGLINREESSETMSPSEYETFLNEQTEDPMPTDESVETIDPSDVTWNQVTTPLEESDDIINILLIGQDRRAGQGRQRSDAMILCTVNKSAKTLTMTSFMRDMYVQIPGYYDDRINVCYVLGGMDLLNKCMEVNFGVQVDGNVEVDFDGFTTVIDMIGGVDINLTGVEADYLNRTGYGPVTEGYNHLNGSQALVYSRVRSIGNSDFSRTERQRKVLNAVVNQCKGLSLTQLNQLLTQMLPLLTTDMTNADMVGYMLELFPLLPDLTIQNQRIPAGGTYRGAWIREMSVLLPDLDANRALLESIMAG